MRVYTYPGYVTLGSAQGGSPKLFRYLEKERGVKCEWHPWHGTLDSLPKKPAMVRASSMMKCTYDELAARCAELGHLCFYDDRIILPNGEWIGGDQMIKEAKKFLDSHQEDQLDLTREKTISYLRSTAADRSTAGETVHALKQAKLLIGLFEKHVLLRNVAPSNEISGDYRAVRVSNLEHTSTWGGENDETAGLDVRGMEQVREQIASDAEKVGGLPYEHPTAQAFFRKLARGLGRNLGNLEIAYGTTELGYGLAEDMPGNLGILLHNFRGRQTQWGGVAFLCTLMGAMLPVLVERLVAAGYPNSDEVVEWEYEAENA